MTPVPDDGRIRVVWRVGDELTPIPATAVVETCSRCRHPVYVDRVITPDPPGCRAVLVCVPCGLADPEMRDWVLRMHAAQRRLTSVLPPAYARRTRTGRRDG